jgi:monothiol glutaredoxin
MRPAALALAPSSCRLLSSDDTHNDFKPQRKTPPVDAPKSVKERIARDVATHPLVVFMKGVPAAPQCGFSNRVVQILNAEGVSEFKAFNVLADAELREGIKEFSAWPTIPQVYIQGEFQGGSDVLLEMYQSGELSEKLKAAGVPIKAAPA